jgi:tetratricopeptide (TPR) repeat protein
MDVDEEFLESLLSYLPESEMADMFAAIGTPLLDRLGQSDSIDEVDRAIDVIELAVTFGDPARAGRLDKLGFALLERFKMTGSTEDLDRAIVTNEEAVESTRDHLRYLTSLGNALKVQFELTGSRDDLNRAIMTRKQAVELTPYGHPDHATYTLEQFGVRIADAI